jgi:hypothetical protein
MLEDVYDTYEVVTAKLFVVECLRFHMPSCLNKFSVHGTDMFLSVRLPGGHLSDEAQEARCKDLSEETPLRNSQTRLLARLTYRV